MQLYQDAHGRRNLPPALDCAALRGMRGTSPAPPQAFL